MQLSSDFCRAQQAIHAERADKALLDNVRVVANKAAVAWGVEAQVAEVREARRDRTRTPADARSREEQFEDEDSPIFSDRPDRDADLADD